MEIYRKPTHTDTATKTISKHTTEHKLAVFNCMLHRLHTLSLNHNNKTKESNIIQKNNGLSKQIIHTLHRKVTKNTTSNGNNNGTVLSGNNNKWITFAYNCAYIRNITEFVRTIITELHLELTTPQKITTQ
jgi:hypothetical protein